MHETIGSFEVVRELGRGGMGVVYLARDTRLDREVAIKAMPAEVAADPVRLERFEREAKTLAQLNHPNLAGIHGVEEQDGARFLVLEYVDGESLADRLDRGAIPVEDAVELAVQIAAGLEAAHDAGVIHRDLKPANVMLTGDGHAKVLDFGLSRSDESHSSSGSLDSPTMTTPQPQHSPTIAGAILGTAAYMSPEQARGRRVDRRTDIWSFGVVLYEMLAGASPFRGETATDSIGAVLHKELDLDGLPPETPAAIRRVLRRCVMRDKSLRYRDIGDVRVELQLPPDEPAPDANPTGGRALPVVTGALAVLCAVLLAAAVWSRGQQAPPTPSPVVRTTIVPPAGTSMRLSGDLSGPAVISRDGTKIVFSAVRDGEPRRLWLRELSDPVARELPGTESAMFPFWSPDGRHVGFFTPSTLRRFDTVSETVEQVCDSAQGRGAAWTEDGRIIFSPRFRGPLVIVDAEGGEPVPLTELNEETHTSHRWPSVIPGTDRYLYIAVSNRRDQEHNNAVYMGRLDSESPPVRVTRSNFGASYANGHLLYVREGALLARPFDTASGEFTDESKLVMRDVHPDQSTWHAQVSASDTGVLVYGSRSGMTGKTDSTAQSGYSWDLEGNRVTSMNYDGRIITSYANNAPIRSMSLSHDGTVFAYETLGDDGYIDIWLHPTGVAPSAGLNTGHEEALQRSIINPELTRFTSLPAAEVMPVWSPDDSQIAFRWDGDGTKPRGIYRKQIGGGTEILVQDNEGGDDYPHDWTPDGRFIIAITGSLLASEQNDIVAIPVDGSETIPIVTEPGTDTTPVISPDGRWLAYSRVSGGRWEVRVVPFGPAWPEALRDRRWVVSQGNGIGPQWSPEGDELFYLTEDADLIAVSVDLSGEEFVAGVPRTLFRTPWDTGMTYAVTPTQIGGDNLFLFVDNSEENDAPLAVLMNWPQLLGRP